MLEALIPNVMDPLATFANQAIRSFSKSYLNMLTNVLDSSLAPIVIINVKLDAAGPFAHCLRRKTTINHLAQAVSALLSNPSNVTEMVSDWLVLDLDSYREQLSRIFPELCNIGAYEGTISWIKEFIHSQLCSNLPLSQWGLWLDSIVDQIVSTIDQSSMGSSASAFLDPESLYRDILLKYTLVSNLFIRDLTIRSAVSFGSFHLLNLLCQEYILHSLEHRLDEQRKWQSIFPSQSNSLTNSMNNVINGFDNILFSTNSIHGINGSNNTIDITSNATMQSTSFQNIVLSDDQIAIFNQHIGS